MSQHSQFTLLKQRRFAPFFWTQFLGAFNDNVFKTALLTVLTFDALHWTTLDVGLLNQLIPGLFILPFVLFSASSGQLADKYEKGRMARKVKLLEVIIMSVAAYGWMQHNLWVLIAAVAGMGIHSTLFGPVKYAYLPQHLSRDELIGGNGLIEMGTFVGILLGEILGALLVVHQPWGTELIAFGAIGIALIGYLTSLRIPYSPAPAPDLQMNWNPWSETLRNLAFSKQNRPVFLSLLGNSWFWFYGAIILAQFPLYAKNYLHGDHGVFVLLLAIFSVGIGSGSLLCEKLSGRKVEIGLVPFGAIGLTVFGLELYFASVAYVNTHTVDMLQFISTAGSLRILFDILLLGVFGGLYIVPLFAVIQTRCDPQHLSRTIAGMNILNAIFMVVASLTASALLVRGYTIPQIFMFTAILNALVALYIFSLVPEFLMRFIAWLLIHTVYRIKTVQTERLPEEGAAILVCNHVSYMDAIVIMALSPRPIRFVMDHRIFKIPFLSWIFRTAKAIPIAPAKEDQWLMEKAYIEIAQALHEGELLCIFPEGKLTATGDINQFKGGIMKILERSPVPVYPMALRGLWGSLLSRGTGNPFQRAFRRGLFSKLELVVAEPIAAAAVTPLILQQKVEELRGDWR
ncbi:MULTISPECIES: MFS transporter [unclassified Undibacterium]|uniref:MFS transporter n=1 Tax=unclassified Undibacterium TaxID=2630295 RepID=UPI002AC95910|nr:MULTISPECIES: MFS transporter [unclassified Undibacterium]MEB0140238.1 MFS transporter [Undibacterium sp. CCC2.1]MEB0173269.1 MFS transporter [Undibacterium sp. CCC1.1]MEB0177108.1 MFS transporter [Undibacterium sp. CCC3.4]MEB0216377.1 MFS transporter [Undibacterium sp. 5I2]WPX42988.1 MFS transporter [Undibacterium sp. CCC3.4]